MSSIETTPAKNPAAEARKKLKYRSEGFGIRGLIVVETITMLFALGPAAATWYCAIVFVRSIWDSAFFYGWLALFPLVVIATFLSITLLMRLSLPKLKPGVYPIGTSPQFLTWMATLYLGHGVRIAGLQPLFSAFYGLKYLYWRAMGANIAYGINSSIFANFSDYPMLTIGRGCTISAFTLISGHTFVGNKVLIAPVNIGSNVYIGYETAISAKTTIGNGAWIGAGNRLLQDKVEANTRIENFEWQHTSPKNSKKTSESPQPEESQA